MEGNESDHNEENANMNSSKTLPPRNKGFHLKSTLLVTICSVLVSLASIIIYRDGFDVFPRCFQHTRSFYYEDPTVEPEVLTLFMSYDLNLDGKIDPKEFVAISRRLFGNQVTTEEKTSFETPFVEENWEQNGEKLILNASFKPLVLTSMTKFAEKSLSGFDQTLQKLKSWRQASKPTLTLPVSAFTVFFPEESYKELGEPWYIIFPQTPKYGQSLSSRRYVAPPVRGNAAVIHLLLSMFHPRPFTMTRLTPQGTAACIEAYNDKFLKIAFRIHAEFQLNEPPLLPFWFSPAQFAGSIVISRDGKHIKSFNMAVPNDRSLNVDMEWLVTEEYKVEKANTDKNDKTDGVNENSDEPANMEVDIGYVREMNITSNGPSCLRDTSDNVDMTDRSCSKQRDHGNIAWKSKLNHHDVEKVLMKFFYPFQEVPYLPFKEAFEKSKELNKPVHHILLWGALNDQSC